MLLNAALTLFFVFLNGFFVAAEFALVKVRHSQLEIRIRSGSKMAKVARSMTSHLDAYLSATQLGITLSSLALGWIGESVVAAMIIDFTIFLGIDLSPETAHQIALPTAFITITILHIVFGELAPKSMAIQKPEQISLAVAMPLKLFYYIFKPFIWLLNGFANLFIRLFGFAPVSEESQAHSADELKILLDEGSKTGVIDDTEHKMLANVFDFSETPVKQIMVPRKNIISIPYEIATDELVEILIEEGYSRLPVYKGNPDNIIGVIYAKDILSMLQNSNLIILHDIIRPAYYVGEDEKISILLENLQREKIHLAIVMDDFGGVAGIVTLEDILEEIVGEIQDEYDEETPIVEMINEEEYYVMASAAINDLNEYLPIDLPESDDYETLGGLIVQLLGRIPELNEEIELDDFIARILQSSKRNIDYVSLSLKEKEIENDEE